MSLPHAKAQRGLAFLLSVTGSRDDSDFGRLAAVFIEDYKLIGLIAAEPAWRSEEASLRPDGFAFAGSGEIAAQILIIQIHLPLAHARHINPKRTSCFRA